jgi:hypothetical protein
MQPLGNSGLKEAATTAVPQKPGCQVVMGQASQCLVARFNCHVLCIKEDSRCLP